MVTREKFWLKAPSCSPSKNIDTLISFCFLRGSLLTLGTSYIDDEAATGAAFDDEGFYKTGDRAHRIGDKYYFDGRVSHDCMFLSITNCPSTSVKLKDTISRDSVS